MILCCCSLLFNVFPGKDRRRGIRSRRSTDDHAPFAWTNILVLCNEELLSIVSLRRGTFASGQKYPKTGLETHGFQGHPSFLRRGCGAAETGARKRHCLCLRIRPGAHSSNDALRCFPSARACCGTDLESLPCLKGGGPTAGWWRDSCGGGVRAPRQTAHFW